MSFLSEHILSEFSEMNIDTGDIPAIDMGNRHIFESLPVFDTLSDQKKEDLSPAQWRNRHNEVCRLHADYTCVYTDGSVRLDLSGCGVWSSSFSLFARLPNGSTIFTCELYAIYAAVCFVSQRPGKFLIFSDSLGSVRALSSLRSSRHYLCSWIVSKLSSLPPDKIVVEWVPSHIDLSGGDHADSLAKSSLQTSNITQIPPCQLTLRHKIRDYYGEGVAESVGFPWS